MKKNNKKGFTIVELVIVIAVIAILSAVLIPTFAGVTESAKESAAKQEARNAYLVYIQANNDVEPSDADFVYKDEKNELYVVFVDGNIKEVCKTEVEAMDKIVAGATANSHKLVEVGDSGLYQVEAK